MPDLPPVVWINLAALLAVVGAIAAVPSAVAWLADRWLWTPRRRGPRG